MKDAYNNKFKYSIILKFRNINYEKCIYKNSTYLKAGSQIDVIMRVQFANWQMIDPDDKIIHRKMPKDDNF